MGIISPSFNLTTEGIMLLLSLKGILKTFPQFGNILQFSLQMYFVTIIFSTRDRKK